MPYSSELLELWINNLDWGLEYPSGLLDPLCLHQISRKLENLHDVKCKKQSDYQRVDDNEHA